VWEKKISLRKEKVTRVVCLIFKFNIYEDSLVIILYLKICVDSKYKLEFFKIR
jgi:hypothetical protein